jgi:hypothetical protein
MHFQVKRVFEHFAANFRPPQADPALSPEVRFHLWYVHAGTMLLQLCLGQLGISV